MDFDRLLKSFAVVCQIIGFLFCEMFSYNFSGPRGSHIQMRCQQVLKGKGRQCNRLMGWSSWRLIRAHRIGGAPGKSSAPEDWSLKMRLGLLLCAGDTE